jgi:hypothetical protein
VSERIRVVAALVLGVLAGAVLTLAVQSPGAPLRRPVEPSAPKPSTPRPEVTEAAATFLAWVPGGLPTGFGLAAARLHGIGTVATVAEDNVWLRRSSAADGHRVDAPAAPFMIPIDAAAVDPRAFAALQPPADRGVAAELARGQGVLGASSAELRGLGPGSLLEFGGHLRVRIADVLPDDQVGAAELLVSRETGARIGIRKDRYLLLQTEPGVTETSRELARRLRALLPASLGSDRLVRVRAPGETPYFRAGDAVMPPVLIKALFGEFAARPAPGRPGYLQIQPSWISRHIVTTRIPVLGTVTCNRALIPQLRDAMADLRRRGLASLVRSYDGCFAPKYVDRDPTAMISHHAWGMAVDMNASTNPFGAPPHQDPRLIRTMERWGLIWGGTFLVPDGNHFEYRRTPAAV